MAVTTLEEGIEAISTQLRILANDARHETNQARRQQLAEAIEIGIQTKQFLLAVKQAHQGAEAEKRAKKEAERYTNYLHRTFG